MIIGKSLGEVLASFGMSVLLVGDVPMVSKFVHEYVKQLERLRLPLSKAANTDVAADVERHAKSLLWPSTTFVAVRQLNEGRIEHF